MNNSLSFLHCRFTSLHNKLWCFAACLDSCLLAFAVLLSSTSILVSGDSHDSVTGFRTKPSSFSAVFVNTCFITPHFSSTFVLLLFSKAQCLSHSCFYSSFILLFPLAAF